MAAAIAILVISIGMIAAGWGYVRTARRMRSYRTTRGTVVARAVAALPGGTREGRWGKGGGYQPKVTYTYAVDGASYTSDRWSYAMRGLKKALVERQLAELPDEVEVYYDPSAPQQAYLQTNTSTVGYVFLSGGAVGLLIGVVALAA